MVKEQNNSRKKIGVLVVAMILLIVGIGGYTYSRYMSSATANSTADIAKWAVKIGANDLDSYTTESPLAAQLTLNANPYVADGVIAPGRSGTYTVEIDPAGSQVAIDYVIKVGAITGLTSTNDKIVLSGAKYWVGDVTGEGTDASVTGADGVTISEGLADVVAGKKVTVKVTVEWSNDEANSTNDTSNGKNSASAKETVSVKTTITAKQHLASDV